MKGTGAKRNVCPGSCVSTGAKFPVAPVELAPMTPTPHHSQFLQAVCSSWHSSSTVRALKAISTAVLSLIRLQCGSAAAVELVHKLRWIGQVLDGSPVQVSRSVGLASPMTRLQCYVVEPHLYNRPPVAHLAIFYGIYLRAVNSLSAELAKSAKQHLTVRIPRNVCITRGPGCLRERGSFGRTSPHPL